MADIFISYARSSEEQAGQVEQALHSRGYSIWRDDELPAHRTYAEVIEEHLKAAKAVVVLWSAAAAKSQWVRAEADAARQAGTLVQASVDGTLPPIPFNQIQCADLKGWTGETDHAGWRKLESSAAALAGGVADGGERQRRPATRQLSVCVLPFINMSGEPEQEYFSDGISEDISTDLSKVSALEVIARNTAFMFKGQPIDVKQVAQTLGVSHVLEGSVRKAGNRVRITAQLIDGQTGGHVWADRYDRDLTDIFAIQDEISKAIVEALKVRLLPKEKKAIEDRGTTSVEAYNLYLMARNYWITGNHGDVRREERVAGICKRAVEIDPNYARAWALMALAQASLKFGYNRVGDGGIAAAERALALDPEIAEAHCVLARNHYEAGRDEEANTELARALELDPNSWEVNKEAAQLCKLRGQIFDATLHYERAAQAMESDFHAWALLTTCYRTQGDDERVRTAARKMVEQAEKALAQDPLNGAALGLIAGGFAILGESERAKEWIDRALLLDPENLNWRYNFACVLANELQDPEGALKLLEPTFSKAGPEFVKSAATDPDFDGIRDDPRFQKALAEAQARLGIQTAAPPTPPPAC